MADQDAGNAASNAPVGEIPAEAKEHWRRGNNLFDDSKFEEAIAEYTKAIEIYPSYSSAYFNRALNNVILKNYDIAKKDLEAVMELEPKSADAPLLMGDIAEQNNDLIGARFWYEKSLAADPNYAEAKNRLERIDNMLHVNADQEPKNSDQEAKSSDQRSKAAEQQMQKQEEDKEIIEEGQIKKLAFYKAKHNFNDVVGLNKIKKYLYENVVLAIQRPDLFKKYGKKLGVGLLLYGPPGVGKCVSGETRVLLYDGRLERIDNIVSSKEKFVATIGSNGKITRGEVSGWWKLPGKELLKISTSSGRAIKCTPEHMFISKSGWIRADRLAEGDEILVPMAINVFGMQEMDERNIMSVKNEIVRDLSAHNAGSGVKQFMGIARHGEDALPPYIFSLNKALFSLFAKSLFFDILKMGKNEAYCFAPNGMLRQLQHILLRLGVNSYANAKESKLSIKGADFKRLANWLIGGKLEDVEETGFEKVSAIEKAETPEFVYDLTVENTHNFIAEDMIVHNTYIVDAVAGEAGANVIIARINQIVDMYTGNTEKNLHAVFQQAREHTPCIILFDEVDALGVKRGGGQEGGESSALRLAVNQFLVEMNGVEANPEGIFVIGTTNQPWDIDPALKRSGRFGDSVYLRPPTYRERKKLIEFYTKNKHRGYINFGRLARATMGYSPADIEHICDKAAMKPLLHEYNYKKERKLNMHDFMSILKDKESQGSSLDEWYAMVKKEVISKTEEQIVDGKKQQIVKEGKLDAQEKVLYKALISDIKKNTSPFRIALRKFMRFWAIYFW
ncbi:MAG: AAA family ATPase [Candidatus Micrarchaeaceae archaeon]